jgi:hypothetical protein
LLFNKVVSTVPGTVAGIHPFTEKDVADIFSPVVFTDPRDAHTQPLFNS